MPATAPQLRRDLALWMVSLRRITLLAGLGALVLQETIVPGELELGVIALVALAVALYNETSRLVVRRVPDDRLATALHAYVAIDTLLLTVLLHFGGGPTNVGLVFFAPAFFAYGAVLPLRQVLVHVGVAFGELAVLGVLEGFGLLARHGFGAGLATPDLGRLLALRVVYISTVNALSAYVSHHLSALLRAQEEESRMLAAERGVLLARNERDAARVRALLDVAQHVSGSQTVEDLLRAVCDTTVAIVRVPRLEIFLWDAGRGCLRLAAARGRGDEVMDGEIRYPGDLPIVARLRAGQMVAFGAAPSHSLVPGHVAAPFRRGCAAPMVCQGSFEGALFVGYDDEDAEELLELVQGIARQAALALVNVRTIEQRQEDAEVSRVLLEISRGLSACLDEEALWSLLVRGASEVLGLPWAIATRFDEHAGRFGIAGSHGIPESDLGALAAARFRLEDFPQMQEALSRCEVVVASESPAEPLPVSPGLRVGSWIAIPLIRGGWVAGFLAAGTAADSVAAFSRRQLRLAEGLGHHASIALQNARLVADLEAADQLKTEFVSTMSHELRTPLNVIIGYTEMLREEAVGPVTSGQRELIERLDARGRELLELIEATLHVGRLEAGRDTLELAPVDVRDLVHALQASTAGLPRPAAVAFDWEAPLGAREQIVTDRAKLALVVRNLVSNAFKFTAEGRVLVRLTLREDALLIDVHDTGIGIGEEHLPLIFEMFRQVDGSMTRRHGGVGLGLYIVKQFVTRLGGTVSVRSVPGRGSQFRVVLPGVVRDEQPQVSAA